MLSSNHRRFPWDSNAWSGQPFERTVRPGGGICAPTPLYCTVLTVYEDKARNTQGKSGDPSTRGGRLSLSGCIASCLRRTTQEFSLRFDISELFRNSRTRQPDTPTRLCCAKIYLGFPVNKYLTNSGRLHAQSHHQYRIRRQVLTSGLPGRQTQTGVVLQRPQLPHCWRCCHHPSRSGNLHDSFLHYARPTARKAQPIFFFETIWRP